MFSLLGHGITSVDSFCRSPLLPSFTPGGGRRDDLEHGPQKAPAGGKPDHFHAGSFWAASVSFMWGKKRDGHIPQMWTLSGRLAFGSRILNICFLARAGKDWRSVSILVCGKPFTIPWPFHGPVVGRSSLQRLTFVFCHRCRAGSERRLEKPPRRSDSPTISIIPKSKQANGLRPTAPHPLCCDGSQG